MAPAPCANIIPAVPTVAVEIALQLGHVTSTVCAQLVRWSRLPQ
ncbi:MAG: hypothetical protein NT062_24905 [Proteobacteria bacterium]|nr:hypothetical protein [Pseudomonadota bacterium]